MQLEIMKQLGVLEEALRNVAVTATRMEDRALEERKDIYDRLDAIRTEISDLASSIKVHDEKFEKVEPVIAEITGKEQRAEGAKHFGKLMWTAIISLITVAVSIGSQVLQYLHTVRTH